MAAGQGIPLKYEKSFRDAVNHAGHKRVEELRALLGSMADHEVAAAVQLCGLTAAYTAIKVVSGRWPTDEGLRLIGEKTAESAGANKWPGITAQNVYLFLSRCALGFEDFTEVLGPTFKDAEDLLMAPFFVTVQLLATFGPKDQSIGEFLDVIEDAYEKAWPLDLNLLPALMVRARMPQPDQGPGTPSAGQ